MFCTKEINLAAILAYAVTFSFATAYAKIAANATAFATANADTNNHSFFTNSLN